MNKDQVTIPQKSLEIIKREFEQGLTKVHQLVNSQAVECYKQSKGDPNEFSSCFGGFYDREQEILPLTEQRMNWIIYRYGNCIKNNKKSEKECLKAAINDLRESFEKTSKKLLRS